MSLAEIAHRVWTDQLVGSILLITLALAGAAGVLGAQTARQHRRRILTALDRIAESAALLLGRERAAQALDRIDERGEADRRVP